MVTSVTDLDQWSVVTIGGDLILCQGQTTLGEIQGAIRDFGSGLLLVTTTRGTYRLDADLAREQDLLSALEPEE